MSEILGFIVGLAILGFSLWLLISIAGWSIGVIGLPATIIVAVLFLR